MQDLLYPTMFSRAVRWQPPYVLEYGVTFGWLILALVIMCFGIRSLVNTVFQLPAYVANLAPLVALAALPSFFRMHSYIYDFFTLATWT